MPLTTRPSAMSRQGMMRLASMAGEGAAARHCARSDARAGARRTCGAALRSAACSRLDRGLEVELALVERPAGDRADDAFVLVRQEVGDVLQRGDAAAGDHRDLELACELDRRIDVDAGQHAVAADVGV